MKVCDGGGQGTTLAITSTNGIWRGNQLFEFWRIRIANKFRSYPLSRTIWQRSANRIFFRNLTYHVDCGNTMCISILLRRFYKFRASFLILKGDLMISQGIITLISDVNSDGIKRLFIGVNVIIRCG